jgi:hypothetical protein
VRVLWLSSTASRQYLRQVDTPSSALADSDGRASRQERLSRAKNLSTAQRPDWLLNTALAEPTKAVLQAPQGVPLSYVDILRRSIILPL